MRNLNFGYPFSCILHTTPYSPSTRYPQSHQTHLFAALILTYVAMNPLNPKNERCIETPIPMPASSVAPPTSPSAKTDDSTCGIPISRYLFTCNTEYNFLQSQQSHLITTFHCAHSRFSDTGTSNESKDACKSFCSLLHMIKSTTWTGILRASFPSPLSPPLQPNAQVRTSGIILLISSIQTPHLDKWTSLRVVNRFSDPE